jgi:histidinol-phosphate/aromatic aminotransferase/cobyric acid decarboxylase-like protein
MRAGSARAHGADVYDAKGLPKRMLDFSSTVLSLATPATWKAQARSALDRLQHYPQPRSSGLAADIERQLGLPEGSVLVSNGSSEALEWLARAASGQAVLLEGPFFGEYLPMLQAAGAKPGRVQLKQAPQRPWLVPLFAQRPWKGAWAWMADPANPSGICLEPERLLALVAAARRNKVRLVLDEALDAQSLEPRMDLALLAAERPGLFVVRSLSKGLGLPGLRLGYVVAHPKEIGKLLPFTRPWSVSSLAQAVGAWVLRQERRLAARRRRELARRKEDLLARLESVGLRPQSSDTGYLLLELPPKGPDAQRLTARLEAQGILIRSCHTYGPWGRRVIRLNPRLPRENARLVSAMAKALGKNK